MLYARTRLRGPVWDWSRRVGTVALPVFRRLSPYPLKPPDAYTSHGGGLLRSWSISPMCSTLP